MYKYLIIDLDDTLVLTSKANSLAYIHALREQEGIDLVPVWDKCVRLTLEVIKQVLLNLETKHLLSLKQRKDILYLSYLCETEINLKVLHLLDLYKRLTPVLLTNSGKKRAVATLEYHQLSQRFTYCFFSRGDNKYQYLLKQLDTTADNCLVVENELAQIELAYQVGFSQKNSIIIN